MDVNAEICRLWRTTSDVDIQKALRRQGEDVPLSRINSVVETCRRVSAGFLDWEIQRRFPDLATEQIAEIRQACDQTLNEGETESPPTGAPEPTHVDSPATPPPGP